MNSDLCEYEFGRWFEKYDSDLEVLYFYFENNFKGILNLRKNNWHSDKIYFDFCKFVYHVSIRRRR